MDEIARRRKVALDAIKQAFGTPGGEQSVTLFVTHHLEELADNFWLKHCGTARPEPKQVCSIL